MERDQHCERNSFAGHPNLAQLHLPFRQAPSRPADTVRNGVSALCEVTPLEAPRPRSVSLAPAAKDFTSHHVGPNRELLIYRLEGRLSVIFVTDCSKIDAIKMADEIASCGYRVELW